MIAIPSKEAMLVSNDVLDERGGNNSAARDRLDSWKEIAAYLRRSVRCVQRWERTEGLPVLRHQHAKGATVYAYRPEVDQWWQGGKKVIAEAWKNPTPSDDTSMRHSHCQHDHNEASDKPHRADYLFRARKADPKTLETLRCSFFQKLGGR